MITASAKVQFAAAGLAVATAITFSPVAAQANPFPIAPALTLGSGLVWGYDPVDTDVLARENPAAASASIVGAAPTPAELLQYLVTGIARGIELTVGTPFYVAIAFTGGLITTLGGFLPGPLGAFVTGLGDTVNNIANSIAVALRVGPYATSSLA